MDINNLKKKKYRILSVKKSDYHYKLKKFKHPTKLIKVSTFRILSKISLIIVSFIILVATFFSIYAISYLQDRNTKTPTPDKVFPTVPLATEIYDRNGILLYRLFNDNSNNDKVDIKDISNIIKAAYISGEDSQFYNHGGFNPQAIFRCTINTIGKKNECGASTITQQLIKLTTKQNQQTVERKVDEILLSMKVEKESTKDQILEMYLRITPYGSNIIGIKRAADFYFGIKDLKQLSLAQATILAAIVNDPTKLSPTISDNTEESQKALKVRQSYILDQMFQKLNDINLQLKNNDKSLNEADPITPEMIDKARSENIVYIKPLQTDIKAGHFVNYAIDELQKRNYKNNNEPFTLTELQTGGYKIYTSLDYNLQQIAERYVHYAGNGLVKWNVHNAAVMTTRPSTGEIITMAGSKDFNARSEGCDNQGRHCKFDPQVNVLTSLESPGSTNKPIGYYEAFRESKLYPGSLLPDIPIKIGNYQPKDWDGSSLGFKNTAREMLRQSRNLSALLVVEMIGVNNYLNVAKSFGYTTYTDTSKFGPSVILGGAEIIPLEHVQAYGVFANGGDLVQVNPILKIVNQKDGIIYQSNPQRQRVADTQSVWLLNQSLYRLNSLGASIAWDNRDIAGKTGTTEDNKDALVMLYSPDFVTLGWGGNNNNEPLDRYNGWPAFVVMPWLKNYMKEIGTTSYFNAKTPFKQPSNVYIGGGDCDTATGLCRGIARDWLISGREPPRGDMSIKKNSSNGFSFAYRMPVPELQHYLDSYIAFHLK